MTSSGGAFAIGVGDACVAKTGQQNKAGFSFGGTLAIVRMIYVSVGPDKLQEAERVWKDECAPLMIKQPGCLSEQLLKCLDAPGEYISYQAWTDQAAIDQYVASDAHEEIKRHARSLQSGSRPIIKHYEIAG